MGIKETVNMEYSQERLLCLTLLLTCASSTTLNLKDLLQNENIVKCGDEFCGYQLECVNDICQCKPQRGEKRYNRKDGIKINYCLGICNPQKCQDNETCVVLTNKQRRCACAKGYRRTRWGQCLGHTGKTPPTSNDETSDDDDSTTLTIGLASGLGGLSVFILVIVVVVVWRRKTAPQKGREYDEVDVSEGAKIPHPAVVVSPLSHLETGPFSSIKPSGYEEAVSIQKAHSNNKIASNYSATNKDTKPFVISEDPTKTYSNYKIEESKGTQRVVVLKEWAGDDYAQQQSNDEYSTLYETSFGKSTNKKPQILQPGSTAGGCGSPPNEVVCDMDLATETVTGDTRQFMLQGGMYDELKIPRI